MPLGLSGVSEEFFASWSTEVRLGMSPDRNFHLDITIVTEIAAADKSVPAKFDSCIGPVDR